MDGLIFPGTNRFFAFRRTPSPRKRNTETEHFYLLPTAVMVAGLCRMTAQSFEQGFLAKVKAGLVIHTFGRPPEVFQMKKKLAQMRFRRPAFLRVPESEKAQGCVFIDHNPAFSISIGSGPPDFRNYGKKMLSHLSRENR